MKRSSSISGNSCGRKTRRKRRRRLRPRKKRIPGIRQSRHSRRIPGILRKRRIPGILRKKRIPEKARKKRILPVTLRKRRNRIIRSSIPMKSSGTVFMRPSRMWTIPMLSIPQTLTAK
jgi:hypothetical protein